MTERLPLILTTVALVVVVSVIELRSVALMVGGVICGLSVIQSRLYFERWRRSGIQRFAWIILLRLAMAGAMLIVCVELALHIGDELTFRLPATLGVEALALVGLLGIASDDERRQDEEIRTRGEE